MSIPYYPGSLYTPVLGLSLFGMDEVLAENMVILDTAYGAGSSIFVNGTLVESPNLNGTLPAAPTGYTNVIFQHDSNGNVSAYASTSGGSSIQVNGSTVSNPNFNGTTPAALTNTVNVQFQVSGSSVSGYVPALVPNKTLYVDNTRTDIFTPNGTIAFPFATITDAINQVIANGDNATYTYLIDIQPSVYAETINIGNASLYNLMFEGHGGAAAAYASSGTPMPGAIVHPASGNALQGTSNVDQIEVLQLSGLTFLGPVDITDTSSDNLGANGFAFVNCCFQGNVTVTAASGYMPVQFISSAIGYNHTLTLEYVLVNWINSDMNWGTANFSNMIIELVSWAFNPQNLNIGSGAYVTGQDGVNIGAETVTVENGGHFSLVNAIVIANLVINSGGTVTNYLGAIEGTITNNGTYTIAGTATNFSADIMNAGTGFRINSAAASGHYLRGNGTNYIDGTIQAADVPTLNQNTTGTAANLSGTPALPNGTTATTQVATDATSLIATDAFVQNAIDEAASSLGIPWFNLIDALDYNQVVPWYNNGSPFAIDTGISRISAGVLGIGTGAQGSVAGGLELNTLQILDSGANVDLLLKNTTAATALTTNASPLLELAVFYDNGGVFTGLDTWSVGSSIAAGSNGASTLTLTHSGSTGLPLISHNSSSFVSTYVGTHTMGSTGGTCTIESGSGSTLQFQPAGTLTHALFGTYMHLANISIGWQPGTTISGNNVDINIARISPAVLGVGIQETSAPLAVAGGVGGSIQATGFYSFGGLVLEQAPSVVGTPTITPTGGSATHYSYEVVALDINMHPIGASAAGSTTTGVATLTTSAFNTVTWTAVQGAFAYAVYRSASSGTPSTTGLLYGSTTLTSVAIATAGYSATYSYASTAINAKLIGQYVLVQGAANAANSGLFYCLSATATSCVLINPYAVAEASSPASATLSSGYVPAIPSGGAALTALKFVDYGWSADGTTAPTVNTHGSIGWLTTYESNATGPALSLDRWVAYPSIASGLNGASTLTFAHTGSTGLASISAPNINAVTAYYANGTVGVSAGPFSAITSIQTVGGIVTVLADVSDERLKDHTPYIGGLREILSITPIKYTWNTEGQKITGFSEDRTFVGFRAQDVQKAIPEAVTQSASNAEYLGLDDRPIIAAMINAFKEQQAQFKQQQAQIEELKEVVRKLAGQ